MTAKILFPVDFSQGAQQALQLAESLARDQGGELFLLHVEEPPMAYGGGEFYYGLAEPSTGELQQMLKNVVVDDPNVPVHRFLTVGPPARTIVEFAAEQGVNYIVMPTHGRTGLTRLLMGSVAEEVVRRATCPVITVNCKAAPKSVAAEPRPKELAHV